MITLYHLHLEEDVKEIKKKQTCVRVNHVLVTHIIHYPKVTGRIGVHGVLALLLVELAFYIDTSSTVYIGRLLKQLLTRLKIPLNTSTVYIGRLLNFFL